MNGADAKQPVLSRAALRPPLKTHDSRPKTHQGFTLLEVMVALAILSVSILVMVDVQSSSVNLAVESEKILIATMLAEDKLVEVSVGLEDQGFKIADVEESGDFEELYSGEFPDYRWEYTLRSIDVSGAASGLSGLLSSAGDAEDGSDTGPDVVGGVEDQMNNGILASLGPEFLTQEVGRFVRELKVRVYYQIGKDEDWVELVTHPINPRGKIDDSDEEAIAAEQEAEAGN